MKIINLKIIGHLPVCQGMEKQDWKRRQSHCFNLSGLFSAIGDQQEARGFI